MQFNLEEAVETLSRTPETLKSLLRDLPDDRAMSKEGADGWSAFDVLGHLVHGEETDWIPRARIILEHGESRAFDPFDRTAMFEKSKGKSLAELLEVFEFLRKKNLESLEQMDLNRDKLKLRGSHPALGQVTLEQLLSAWVVHDLSHAAQILRILCKQYDEEVGPWKAYLPILTRN
ncbi:MAG TPA: DinB family protein [Blastocatellia bacterium]|nr:DinB family protein [Blastocatellia bacterium]